MTYCALNSFWHGTGRWSNTDTTRWLLGRDSNKPIQMVDGSLRGWAEMQRWIVIMLCSSSQITISTWTRGVPKPEPAGFWHNRQKPETPVFGLPVPVIQNRIFLLVTADFDSPICVLPPPCVVSAQKTRPTRDALNSRVAPNNAAAVRAPYTRVVILPPPSAN